MTLRSQGGLFYLVKLDIKCIYKYTLAVCYYPGMPLSEGHQRGGYFYKGYVNFICKL